MNWSDVFNGCFELFAGILSLMNVRQAYKDKQVKGVHWLPTVFFSTWGAFNLWFYPVNSLWFSFAGGLSIFGVNLWWLSLMWYYRKRK